MGQERSENRFQVLSPIDLNRICIGYAGYVPGVKSENMYGKTFGKTTFTSSTGEYSKGIDQESHEKFKSVAAE